VDDQPEIRQLVRTSLEDQDFELLEAASGQEALSLARQQRPDLILLDVLMPDIDGFSVCREIKADPAISGTKVIMLTAKTERADREQARAAGADFYIPKPFSPIELQNIIHRYLT